MSGGEKGRRWRKNGEEEVGVDVGRWRRYGLSKMR